MKLTLVLQPEMAYIKKGKKVISSTDPPEGFLFDPCFYKLDNTSTQEEVFWLLASHMTKVNHAQG